MRDKGTKQAGAALTGPAGGAGCINQGSSFHEGEVGHGVHLEIGPEVLHGIEPWGIGREGNDPGRGRRVLHTRPGEAQDLAPMPEQRSGHRLQVEEKP